MGPKQILFVDDDKRLWRLVQRYLEHAGYRVICVGNADELHSNLEQNDIDLILLDIMLPGKDGLTIANEIRTRSSIPIIFLTAKAEIDDKVSGLDVGADDYITKPFEEKELLARVHSVLRRTLNRSADVLRTEAHFAGWKLNLLNQTLTSPEGERVDITSNEYRLLSTMVSKPNVTIKREEILNILSGREWSPLVRSADMAISKLRKKLAAHSGSSDLIKTVRNQGYQFTAPVSFIESEQ